MCVDYLRVNAVTKLDCFLLPRLDEPLDAVAGCSVFSSLDLAMAYHQEQVSPSDVENRRLLNTPAFWGDQDAVRPVHCAVHLPAAHVDNATRTDDAHVSRTSTT